MIAGLPVVTSNLRRPAEIVQEAQCGILVEPGRPGAMAEAIQWLLEHPMEAKAMGNRGREAIIKTYNWNSQAQVLLDLYFRVVFRSASSAAGFSVTREPELHRARHE
jgi:glycosyltransferase involved in cell wall biosynthesis